MRQPRTSLFSKNDLVGNNIRIKRSRNNHPFKYTGICTVIFFPAFQASYRYLLLLRCPPLLNFKCKKFYHIPFTSCLFMFQFFCISDLTPRLFMFSFFLFEFQLNPTYLDEELKSAIILECHKLELAEYSKGACFFVKEMKKNI